MKRVSFFKRNDGFRMSQVLCEMEQDGTNLLPFDERVIKENETSVKLNDSRTQRSLLDMSVISDKDFGARHLAVSDPSQEHICHYQPVVEKDPGIPDHAIIYIHRWIWIITFAPNLNMIPPCLGQSDSIFKKRAICFVSVFLIGKKYVKKVCTL